MKRTIALFTLAAATLITPLAVPAFSQTSPLQLPPALEKSLAAHASDVTEVTLGKNMLEFAAKFMNGKDKDDEATRALIQGLDGIYVRSYEFDKEGQYSMVDLDQLRRNFASPEWTPMVHTRELKSGETTDILVKQVNGEPHGIFILTAEPKELTIVLILGPIHMSDLGKLNGLGGLSALGDVEKSTHHANRNTNGKDGDE